MNRDSRPSLALLSLNVNGLGSKAKRQQLFHALLTGRWDIVLLQETHHKDEEQGLQWTREGAGEGRPWPGVSFWTHGTTASRGVAILVRDRADWEQPEAQQIETVPAGSDTLHEPEGRLLRVDLQWQGTAYSILSVYSPCQAEHRGAFFTQQLLPAIPVTRQVIVAGDFNCVADDLDVTSNAAGSRRTGFANGLQPVQQTYGLTDVWREQHPSTRAITHVCAASLSGGEKSA